MSVLVRAALLGGLAYVVSRAIKGSRDLHYADDARQLQRAEDSDQDELWPTSAQASTGST